MQFFESFYQWAGLMVLLVVGGAVIVAIVEAIGKAIERARKPHSTELNVDLRCPFDKTTAEQSPRDIRKASDTSIKPIASLPYRRDQPS